MSASLSRWRVVPSLTVLGLLAAFSRPAAAQVTSGSVAGVVRTEAGAPLSDVVISLIYVPTGQRVVARSKEDGRFLAGNLYPGSPYLLISQRLGYKPDTLKNLSVLLGQTVTKDVVMREAAAQLAAIEVSSSRAPVADRTKVSAAVNAEQINKLPTLSRSIQDMTRVSSNGNGVSFAGSNYRYNNLTIDGAVSNDAFGFSQSSGQSTASVPTGTPGGLARTQPISIDAIEQVTVAVAPFDVRIGNFTGGSINAVTKSGTNTTQGSLYTFGRNNSFVGSGLTGSIPSDFKETQIGGRIGGPIVKNRVFYFLNAEVGRRTDPVLFAPGTAGAQLSQAVAKQVQDSLRVFASRAGYSSYDPGTIGAYSIPANNAKFFGRLDAILNDHNTLTIRDNYVDAKAGNLERGAALNKLASQDFLHLSTTNGTVAELKSQFSGASNSLILGLSTVSDKRQPYGTQIAPQIEIQDIQYGQINAGSDREAAVYRQKTRTIELTDNLTFAKGIHTFTLGTHNEFYNVQYTFLNSYNGRWQYPNVAAFLANKPSRIRATYLQGDNSLASALGTPQADFNVSAPSFYAEDEMQLTPRLKATVGLRADLTMTDAPAYASGFSNLTAADGSKPYAKYTGSYKNSFLLAPRAGVVWDVKGDGSWVLRGGSGVFQGRMPFAWFAYPYINNGSTVANVDYRPTYTTSLTSVPLIVDPTQQRTINSLYNQGNVYEINLIDNKFVQPQMWRSQLATDIKLPTKGTLTFDGTYTQVIKDILFTNIGLPAPVGNLGGADTRPIYAATRLAVPTGQTNPYSSVFLLSNTNKGYRYSVTADLRQPIGALELGGSYTYGQAKDVANGQRNSPQSNVEYNQMVVGNTYPLTYSNYDVRHRVVGTASYTHRWTPSVGTIASLIYAGSSGTPFSYVYSGDLNGDGQSNNDLFYIPRNASEITLIPSSRPSGQTDTRTAAQIWADLDAYISSDKYLNSHRGQYAQRNGGRTPWNHRADFRLVQDVATQSRLPVQVTFDILNLTALMNNSWGKFYFVPNLNNQNTYIAAYRSGRAVGAAPSISFDPIPGNKPYQVDDIQSRWQMQLGLRVSF
jgi:hypothetical protein